MLAFRGFGMFIVDFCDSRLFGKNVGKVMAAKTNPITFIKQVRAETAKVTWPSRRETTISTIMVLMMAAFAAAFFFIADQIMNFGVWESIDLLKRLFS